MKIVLDANVLLSGLVTGSAAPAQLIALWEEGRFNLYVSEHILDGVLRALSKPYWQTRLDRQRSERRLSDIRALVIVVEPITGIHGIAADDEDDLVLATAVADNADYLVTGDKYMLRIGEFRGIPIVSPRAFLDSMLETS
jgi:putative PIN family toxin of toxin-antitoxin system